MQAIFKFFIKIILPMVIAMCISLGFVYVYDSNYGKRMANPTYAKLLTLRCAEGETQTIRVKPSENGLYHEFTSDCGEERHFGSHTHGSIDRRLN